MRPIYLYLPVCLLGIPLLVGLLVASGQSDESTPPAETIRQLRVLLQEACRVFCQRCIYLSIAGHVELVKGRGDENS